METPSGSYKKKFEEQGFVVIPQLVEEKELKPVRRLTKDIISHFEQDGNDPFSEFCYKHRVDQGVLFDLYVRHPEFRRLAQNPKLIEALTTLMGPDIFMYENSLVYKPKGKRNEVPWHQDFINRPEEPTKLIVWVALDDVNPENGALKFIPGSHHLGFLPWYTVKGETHHTRLKLDGVDVDNYRYGNMKAGDVLIFHHLIVHASDRVSTDTPRRAYRFSVQSFQEIYSPRGIPMVLAGGHPSVYAHARSKSTRRKGLKGMINQFGRKLANL